MIDLLLKRKERDSRIDGGYFRDFGNEILQRTKQDQDQTNKNEIHRENETHRDAESTTSNNSEETVTTHESGAYPAIPVQEYRDSPIEDIAVHSLRRNRVVGDKAKRNKEQEDNVRSADMDFMLDLKTLNRETAADSDHIELNCCIEYNNTSQIP